MKKALTAEREHKEFLLKERVKELECLYGISELVSKPNLSLNEIFEGVILLISQAWQYPEITHSRIIFDDGRELLCPHGRLPIVEKLSLSSDIIVKGKKIGIIKVFYSEKRPEIDGDVFLKEERSLLSVISERLGQVIEKFEAELNLKESQQKLGFHIEHTPIGVMEFDDKFKVVSWNPAAEKIFGYSKSEIVGRDVLNSITPLDIQGNIMSLFDGILEGKYVENINDNITKDGRKITCKWFNTRLINDEGEVTGSASFCQDITNQIQADKTLRASEQLLRILAENYPSFLSVIEKDYTVCFSAGLPFKKLNLNPDDFKGHTLEQVFGELSPIVKEHYQEAFKGKEVSFELEFEGQNQYYRVIPIENKEGGVDKLLAVVDNIN
jgi:PAS domain S-box-containing protein